MNSFEWLNNAVKPVEAVLLEQAQLKQNNLTKPPGSLGLLEEIAIRLSAMQQTDSPVIKKVSIVVYAADHGIADENVSAFPQAVTAEMVKNFSAGGAAISVLAKELGAKLQVANLGTVVELDTLSGVIDKRIAAGTQNFLRQPAMNEAQLTEALLVAQQIVENEKKAGCELFIAGDMGIANTSSATAIACALMSCSAEEITGRGTGLDDNGLAHKIDVIQRSLQQHRLDPQSPVTILQTVGGFEIAAMTASYIRCAQLGLPALVDGFIATSAAMLAIAINPEVKNWLFFAHASAEPGHKKMMEFLQVKPLIDFNLRLGEGSGAAVVVPLMRMACALHNNMATFAQAGVSEGQV